MMTPVSMPHRIHEGSPCKVRTPKRVFDTAREEGTVVWKARRVVQPEDLDAQEVYITHRKITTENDCCHALAKIGVSQTVLVSEALGILADLVDIHFESLSDLAEYRHDVKTILQGVRSESGKRSFCRFAYAIFHGCKQDGEVFDAIARSGMALFKDVLEAIACDHPTNEALKWMTGSEEATEFDALLAWSKMFPLLEERHKKSRPFKFIAGDVLLAEQALEVLKFIAAEAKQEQGQYQVLVHVIQAALPIVEERIAEKKKSAIAEKALEKMDFEEVRKRLHMLKHL